MAFEIAARCHVIVLSEEFAILDAQRLEHVVVRPDVKLPLLAFGIGIERGGESALRGRHLALEPFHGFVCAHAVKRFAAAPLSDRQELEELGIVVEHFLEVRHQPALVDRIAREAAAEMVVDAALADVVEGDLDGSEITSPLPSVPRLRGRVRVGAALPGAPQQLEQRGLRKFRCAAGAAVHRIDEAAELARGVVELGHADCYAAGRPCRGGKTLHQSGAVVLDLLRLLAKQARDLAQHIRERGLRRSARFWENMCRPRSALPWA